MAVKGEPVYYSHLPTPPPSPPDHHQYSPPPPPDNHHYIVLPVYHHRSRQLRCHLTIATVLILIALSIYLLWPTDPSLNVVRLHLEHIRIRILPVLSLDISLFLTVKVRNRDFFSLDYNSLDISIGYRGKQLGFVNSEKGHLKARGSSYVNATLQFDGIEILYDAFHLIGDIAKGSVPFDTVMEIQGQLGLFFFDFPLKTKVSCEFDVNVDKQTVTHQDCYPE